MWKLYLFWPFMTYDLQFSGKATFPLGYWGYPSQNIHCSDDSRLKFLGLDGPSGMPQSKLTIHLFDFACFLRPWTQFCSCFPFLNLVFYLSPGQGAHYLWVVSTNHSRKPFVLVSLRNVPAIMTALFWFSNLNHFQRVFPVWSWSLKMTFDAYFSPFSHVVSFLLPLNP